MADVATSFYDWSTTASSNLPAGSTNVGTGLDNNLQQIQATVRAALGSKGADIASASTTDLGAVAGLFHDITGTTTITSFGTIAAGVWKVIKFEGALTLTHNATSLILPGGANITTADGDVAIMFSEGSGNWRCANYLYASEMPIRLTDPNADRILFWDDSAGALAWLTAGLGLSISTTTVTAGPTAGTKQNSTSGTEIDFTGIPAGVRRIEMMLAGVSTNGTSNLIVQLGDSGGIETSGYLGASDNQALNGGQATSFTAGLGLARTMDAGYVAYGVATFVLLDSSTNQWVGTWVGSSTGTATVSFGSTSKSLSGTLDRIRLTTSNGTDAFDAGTVNIVYS